MTDGAGHSQLFETNMSPTFLVHIAGSILSGTPVWVFVLFAYLAWQGWQRLSPRVTTLRRVAVMPVIFIAWGLIGLVTRPVAAETVATIWSAAATAGGILGALTSPRSLEFDRTRGLVRRPGSILPLLRNLSIFGAHYGLNVAMAMRPDARMDLIGWDIAVSGLSAGYFLGWMIAFLRTAWRAPPTDLSAFHAPSDRRVPEPAQ